MTQDRCPVFDVWIHPRNIHLLTSIIEAYEGLGVVSTEDPRLALVRIAAAPGREVELLHILHSEQKRLEIRSIQNSLRLQ